FPLQAAGRTCTLSAMCTLSRRAPMAVSENDKRWMEGRTRHVRVYLTEEERALVRAAAALADRSVSRFAVEAIVEAAKGVAKQHALPAEPLKRPSRQPRKIT